MIVKLPNHSLLLTICGCTIVSHDIDRGLESQLKNSQENCDKSKICQVSVPTASLLLLHHWTSCYQFSENLHNQSFHRTITNLSNKLFTNVIFLFRLTAIIQMNKVVIIKNTSCLNFFCAEQVLLFWEINKFPLHFIFHAVFYAALSLSYAARSTSNCVNRCFTKCLHSTDVHPVL